MQNILTLWTNPLTPGGRKAASATFLNQVWIAVDFMQWNVMIQMKFSKPQTVSQSHQNFMAIDPAITKSWTDKRWSLCKLISKYMHANMGQTNDAIMMKLDYHKLKWVLQS